MIIDGEHNTKIIHNDNPKEEKELSDIILAQCSADSVCQLLRAIRKIRKMTILDVAEKSGISRNTIGQIESGNKINNSTLTTLSKIAHAINCDLRIELIPFEKFTDKKEEK